MNADIQIGIDAKSRIVTFSTKKPLDLAPTAIYVPFAAIKATAATIMHAEVQQEMRAANEQRVVRPDV